MTGTNPLDMRVPVLMAIQRALLGMVTPSLRSVLVSWDERRIDARFIYDTAASENVELVQEVETEVLADFDDHIVTDFSVEVVAPPSAPAGSAREIIAYLRREA